MPNMLNLKERIASTSPGGATFGVGGEASATMTYIVDGPLGSSGKVGDFLNEVFPSSWMVNQSHIQRFMPMAHPYYRWLYATNISSIKGIGLKRTDKKMEKVLTGGDKSYQKVPEYFGSYDKYEITVNFSTLPYLVIPDDQVTTIPVYDYYKDNGDAATAENVKLESNRFVSFSTSVVAEYLTVKTGQFKFLSDDPVVNEKDFPGFGGKTLVPKTVLNMTWHQVPYDFVFPTLPQSENIYNGLGRVNQWSFLGFGPGELLFTGTESKPYPKNFFGSNFNTLAPLQQGFTLPNFLYADIIFKFLYVGFDTNFPYERNANNQSFVYRGHNLGIHYQNQKYYPLVSKTKDTFPLNERYKPVYDSYPFDLLFHGTPATMV